MIRAFCRNTFICRLCEAASFLYTKFSCKSYRNPTVPKNVGFWHFSQKIVISRYKRHGYHLKENKIFYKKGLRDHIAILSHWAANRVWKVEKSIFDGFWHFSQKIVISRYKRHGYHLKENKILYKKGLRDQIAILSH